MDNGDEEAAAPPAPGTAPRKWAGSQRTAKVAAAPSDSDESGSEGGEDGEGEGTEGADGAEGTNADADAPLDSLVTARLAEASIEDGGDANGDPSGEKLPPAGLSPEDAEALRKQLDERLQAAAAGGAESSGADEARGREVWAACEALTAGLASELTEQLRLILEPTLASRLAGDYRTGKRLNMKKVIAYIASHFRKDKIWMRRTRPDKRRYQVSDGACCQTSVPGLFLALCCCLDAWYVSDGCKPAGIPTAVKRMMLPCSYFEMHTAGRTSTIASKSGEGVPSEASFFEYIQGVHS